MTMITFRVSKFRVLCTVVVKLGF